MSLEATQLRLRLTKDPIVIKQLKKNRAFRSDVEGEYFPIMFDGAEYRFRPGLPLNVGRQVGKALIRSSAVIIGDQLTGDFRAGIEEIGEFELGVEAPVERISTTACPICHQDCRTLPRLARHIMTCKVAKQQKPDLYDESVPEDTVEVGAEDAEAAS